MNKITLSLLLSLCGLGAICVFAAKDRPTDFLLATSHSMDCDRTAAGTAEEHVDKSVDTEDLPNIRSFLKSEIKAARKKSVALEGCFCTMERMIQSARIDLIKAHGYMEGMEDIVQEEHTREVKIMKMTVEDTIRESIKLAEQMERALHLKKRLDLQRAALGRIKKCEREQGAKRRRLEAAESKLDATTISGSYQLTMD